MSYTYCLYDTNQMTPDEAATFMLNYGDYVTYEHLSEAATAAFLDLSDFPLLLSKGQSKMRKLIRVKQEHIDAASYAYSDRSCPIARAIRDVFPDLDIRVGHYMIRLGHNFKPVEQPTRVHAFVRKYDNPSKRKSVKPFNFYLEVPDNA